MKDRPDVKKNQGQCLHEPSVVPLSLENWLQNINYCIPLETIAALRKHNVSWAVTYEYPILLMCGSRN